MKQILSFGIISVVITSLFLISSSSVSINDIDRKEYKQLLNIENTNSITPSMTTMEKTITKRALNGLLIFDVNTECFWFFDNSWMTLDENNAVFSVLDRGVDLQFKNKEQVINRSSDNQMDNDMDLISND